ncbi:hypothetical protein [Enterovirga sp.]|jgi:hypothetical protein|uniref:hypothetical protein n=1 Tax=Enterovirga sp. TaxID=2026350 RepID=UPI00261B3F20|nr:hypothetical protein [Enterovirga sp.]MDB5590413.1 hypothetical protein [Enterovirga sp.]
MRVLLLVASLFLLAAAPARAQTATVDDTARFLAGLPPSADSPLAALAAEPRWKQHASGFDATFRQAEARTLSRVRNWAAANLSVKRPTLYYMFSGPDFLYANAFFPDATTYVMAGLEPVGHIPDVQNLPKATLPQALGALQISMRSILSFSFFLTKNMQGQLRATPLNGTLPVLYVFLSRAGKTLRDVSLVYLDDDGTPVAGARPAGKTGAQGAKIVFAGAGGPEQTLYYFSTNIADDGFRSGGIGRLGDKLGEGVAFVKSASYLMHSPNFSQVRSFLLDKSAAILEDDSGIPVTYFDPAKWQLKPYGRYLGPITLFAGRGQPRLRELYAKGRPTPIDFGIGYRWRPNESNLLWAVKRDSVAAQ